MKKKITFLIPLLSLIYTSGYGDEKHSQVKSDNEKYPHHIYFGPEFTLFDLNTHVDRMNIYGLNFFTGLNLRYEYLKPKSFYAGVDIFSSLSADVFNARFKKFNFHRNNSCTTFGNVELRMGYTFASEKSMFTPFLGIGAYGFENHGSYYHFSENMFYYAFGLRSLFELNRSFSAGVNWKLFRTSDTEQKFKFLFTPNRMIKLQDNENTWGGEIGVPIICYLGSKKKWEVQLEPYFLTLNFAEVQNIYGTRLLFGYRF